MLTMSLYYVPIKLFDRRRRLRCRHHRLRFCRHRYCSIHLYVQIYTHTMYSYHYHRPFDYFINDNVRNSAAFIRV